MIEHTSKANRLRKFDHTIAKYFEAKIIRLNNSQTKSE